VRSQSVRRRQLVDAEFQQLVDGIAVRTVAVATARRRGRVRRGKRAAQMSVEFHVL